MKTKLSFVSTAFDLYLLFALFIFFTGGGVFIQGNLHELIQQKPWLHRVAVLGVTITAYLWYILLSETSKSQTPSLLTEKLSRLPISSAGWLWVLFLFSAGLWTTSSWVRHEALHSSFDMAIFVQAVWNTLHGDFLYSSIKGGICLLGDHFSPILAAFVPFYFLWEDPKCLLLIQAAAATSSVFPLYLIAREKHHHTGIALLYVLALVLYLPLRNSVRFDFHPEVVVIPLLFWIFYFLERQKMTAASISLAIVLLSKETAAPVTFALGFYAFVFARQRIWGFFWMVFSCIYFIVVINKVIPYFSGQDYFYLSGNLEAWKHEGAAAFIKHFFSKDSVAYVVKVMGPVGFLSFLNPPAFLLTLPILAQNLLSRNEAVRSIFFQYTTFLTPFIFISAVYGGMRIPSKTLLGYYLMFFSLAFTGVSEYYVLASHRPYLTPENRAIKQYLRRLPEGVSVRTLEVLAPHAANRKELHIFENDHPKEGGSEKALNADYVIVHEHYLNDSLNPKIDDLLKRGYRLAEKQNGMRVYRK